MNPERVIKYLFPFFVFAILSRSIDEINIIYYTVPLMCLIFIAYEILPLKNNIDKVKNDFKLSRYEVTITLIPGLWFILTSTWSSYPEVSALRALYFILITFGCISGATLWMKYSDKDILEFLLPGNLIVVLLCFFSLATSLPSDSWTGGHGKSFMGFFGHQNTLASNILFTIPAVFYLRDKVKSQKSKRLMIFYFLLLSANLFLLILTYSRSAIISLIAGVFVYLILNKKWKLIAFSSSVITAAAIIIYLTPQLNNLTSVLLKKDFPEFYSSRMWMWEPSYKAAINGGLTGLGYGISDPDIKPGSLGDHYEDGRFIREKGNSLLAMIEETGVIGCLFFLLPVFYLFLLIKNNKLKTGYNNTSYSILISSMAAFFIHAQFEAWWVGVGSVQLPIFFIYLGLLFKRYRGN